MRPPAPPGCRVTHMRMHMHRIMHMHMHHIMHMHIMHMQQRGRLSLKHTRRLSLWRKLHAVCGACSVRAVCAACVSKTPVGSPPAARRLSSTGAALVRVRVRV